MHCLRIVFILFGLSLSGLKAQRSPPETRKKYDYKTVLISPDKYILYRSYNTTTIEFELKAKNSSWLLFGIRGSSYSDVIVASVFPDGTGHFSERTLMNKDKTLTINPKLNWFLTDAFISNDYLVVKVYRNIKVQCNQSLDEQSLNITTGLDHIVYATGSYYNTTDDSISLADLKKARLNLLRRDTCECDFTCLNSFQESAFNPIPTGYYEYQRDLINDMFRLYWNISDGNITAEVHCQTGGWVSFGLSPTGSMDGSNVIIGFIASDGSVIFSEYIMDGSSPYQTQNQTVLLLSAGLQNGISYFKFTRSLTVCDYEHLSYEVSQIEA